MSVIPELHYETEDWNVKPPEPYYAGGIGSLVGVYSGALIPYTKSPQT